MIPVMIGIAAASALVQYLNSKEGRELSAAEREKLQRQIDAIKQPNFDYSKFDPKLLKVVGTYTPEVADFIVEKTPELIKADSEGAKKGRDAQMAALSRLTELSKSGEDELTRLERTQAMNDVANRNRGQVGAVSESFARRGQAGGSQEMLAQMFNAQEQNDQQAETGSRFAIEAQRRKLQSLMDSASLGGRIRNEDIELESTNNNILNDFNRRFAANKQQWANNAADTRNGAQRFNLGLEQEVADRNVGISNDAAQFNLKNYNGLQQSEFDNALSKLGINAKGTQMAREDINSTTNATNNAFSGLAGGAMSAYMYADAKEGRQKDREAYVYKPTPLPTSMGLTENPPPPRYRTDFEEESEMEYETSGNNPLRRKYKN